MFQNKLNIPRVGSDVVRRTKIEEKLRLLPDYKLAYLSAPAGYGKTTAVVDYLKRTDMKHAWLSIDENDNDPIRFWKYLVASVSGCLDDESITRLSIDDELISSNITMNLLIDVLESVPESFILIFDDCHLIDNEVILKSIEYFVRYMPQNVSLILLSRKEPENMLSLLRARGTVISLGIHDIAFDYDETAEFFAQKGFNLTADEVRTIERYTEGWAAGLVAAFFSIRESDSINNTVSALSGKDKNIALLLEKEVFIRWPEEVRDFLTRTAFLDRLSGSLCAAITGNERSEEILRLLSERNSFVVPLDSEYYRFRYHHLFQEFLLKRLEREAESVRRELYGKAGSWFLENGDIEDAVNWLLKAGEYDKAYPYISNYRFEMMRDRDYSLWKKWVDSIPERLYETDPTMYVSYSWVSSMENRPDIAEIWSEKARDGFERIKQGFERKEKDALEAYVLFSDLNNAVQKMDMERIFRDYDSLSRLELSAPVLLGELNWNEPSLLKTAYGFKGRLDLVEKYLPLIDSLPQLIGSFSTYIALIVAEFYYERNNLDQLGVLLTKHMGYVTEVPTLGAIVPSFILLAKSKRAKGDISGAFNDVQEARRLLAGKPGNVWSYFLDIFMSELYLSVGDADAAARYIETGRLSLYDPLSAVREYEYIVYARYLMLVNRPDDALILLSRLEGFARRGNQLVSQIQILCLEAVSNCMKSNYISAMSFLEQAFSLGMGAGYIRTFADEGEPMATLLKKYVSVSRGGNGRYLSYARRLLRATVEYAGFLKDSGQKTHSDKSGNGLARLLTKREIVVLRLLAEKKSNEEIANKLFVSLSAVKQCNTRIYDKLGVKNRLEAIGKAIELGLAD